MKKRSGEAQAAQRRPPVVMKHRLTPRGGAKNEQVDLLADCTHESASVPGDADPDDHKRYCDLCGARVYDY